MIWHIILQTEAYYVVYSVWVSILGNILDRCLFIIYKKADSPPTLLTFKAPPTNSLSKRHSNRNYIQMVILEK